MYTPISIDVFCAAYAGALGGYQKGRFPDRNVASQYLVLAEAALAFATEFDTQFAVVLPNELQLQEIETLAAEIMTYPNNSTTALAPTTYTTLCDAIIAMMAEASSVVVGNIPTPIPVPTPVALSVLEVPTVAGIAGSLYATVPITAIAAVVDGHSTKGDLGGGCFFWDPTSTATDDGGTVVNPTGHVGAGRWIRIYDGALSVRWFGVAPSTSITLNTSRLNALLAAFPSGTIYFPNGEYDFNDTINFHSMAGAHIYGDGQQSTILAYNTTYAPITFIDFFQCSYCVIEKLTFYARPVAMASTVDKILQAHAGLGILAQNVFRNCGFQGGKIAGVHVGSDAGTDTNIDMNSFERCISQNNDGVGWIISDNNNANSHFFKCATQNNGSWGWQIKNFPINVVFEQPVSSNCGLTSGGDTQAGNGFFRIEKTFGTTCFIYDHEYELSSGTVILSTAPGSGGVSAEGTVVVRGLRTSNNNVNGKKIFDCQAGMSYVLEDAIIVGNGTDGSCSFNPVAAAFPGARSLFTRNVLLSDGATLDVRVAGVNAMRWDGSGIITQANFSDTTPTAPTGPNNLVNANIAAGANIAGSKVNPNFGAQDIAGRNITGTATIQTTGGTIQSAGEIAAVTGGVSATLASYPADASYSGLWLGINFAFIGNSNFVTLSNGAGVIHNTPDAAGIHEFHCGFTGTIIRMKGTGAAPQFRFGNGAIFGSQVAFTVTNHVDDLTLDESLLDLPGLTHVVGTIIKYLQLYGWFIGTTT